MKRFCENKHSNNPTTLKPLAPIKAKRSPTRLVNNAAGILLNSTPIPISAAINPESAYDAPSSIADRAKTGRIVPWAIPKRIDGPKAVIKTGPQAKSDDSAVIEKFYLGG